MASPRWKDSKGSEKTPHEVFDLTDLTDDE